MTALLSIPSQDVLNYFKIENLTLFTLDKTTGDFNERADEPTEVDSFHRTDFFRSSKTLERMCKLNVAIVSSIWGFVIGFFNNFD